MKFRVLIEQDEDGMFIAQVPSLPGCVSQGKTRDEATQLFEDFRRLMTGDAEPTGELGKLEILSGVRDYPVRIKCAVLAWHALHSALSQGETVTTE